jgi:hypothetical protein
VDACLRRNALIWIKNVNRMIDTNITGGKCWLALYRVRKLSASTYTLIRKTQTGNTAKLQLM